MRISSFESEIYLSKEADLIFPFFADARNLHVLTPPWLHFQILTKDPILMYSGTLIDYLLRIRGIPLRWQTRIDEWEPPYRFVDSQLKVRTASGGTNIFLYREEMVLDALIKSNTRCPGALGWAGCLFVLISKGYSIFEGIN
jgi:hypothetical protein